ncbi:hypothetical protein TIFTF001_036517 [Ficus carica]|uniref:Uncharacterized protein n=1 Tax=Ficus carica TaxID=3494 RepID=A0AA88E4I7_FICCA|nr:hypothetical protein TIFTF001_036517 [Ficus carica]
MLPDQILPHKQGLPCTRVRQCPGTTLLTRIASPAYVPATAPITSPTSATCPISHRQLPPPAPTGATPIGTGGGSP